MTVAFRQFGGSEAVLTAISDEFPILKKYRELTVGVLFTFYFIVGLGSCTQVGHELYQTIAPKYGLYNKNKNATTLF